jgi:superfamily II helicase
MTNNGKLLAAVALGPVVADYLEDAELRFEAKKRANKIIAEIRSFDEWILKGADMTMIEQQVNIQRAFRQWIETNFTEDENEATD